MASGGTSEEPPKELIILHTTDVHVSFDNISRLRSHLESMNQRVDVVLLSGDLANCPMEDMSLASEHQLQEHHQMLDKVVTEFVPMAKQVFYIPGNHDVLSTFATTESLSSPVNVHLRCVKIAPGLHLMGTGGSIPGFRDGTQCWDSFPYPTDDAFAEDLNKVMEPLFGEGGGLTPSDAVIIMTHIGPDQSNTTVARADPAHPVISGSASLYKHLCRECLQKHVVLNVHGHTHDAPGSCRVGRTTVINPGALVEERYGIYTLSYQAKKAPQWKLTSIRLLNLP